MVMVLIASLLVLSPSRSNAEKFVLQLLPSEKCVAVPDGTHTYSYDIHGNVDGSVANLKIVCSTAAIIVVGGGGRDYRGRPVKLKGDPGRSIKVSTTTDEQGNFHFDKLPAGNYTLKLDGLPDQLLTVGTDGIAGGKVMRASDGSMSIFDRWGNQLTAKASDDDVRVRGKAAKKPVGFGTGNTIGVGPGIGGPMLPGSGPGLGPVPVGPGGGAMGRPGGGKP